MKLSWAAAALVALATQFTFAGQAVRWQIEQEPATLVNGAPVLFRVLPPQDLAALRGSWLTHEISFRRSQRCKCWYALAGVPLDTKPGQYALELEGESAGGARVQFSQPERVGEAKYPSTTITVEPKYVQPPKEVLARIAQEQTLKKEIFSESGPESLWSGRFEAPASTGVTAVFGAARVYNGIKRSQHEGLDFRAHPGTPVRAANAGRVILARKLYFEGNCVVLDHGQGLMTIYMHLSKFKVKQGEKVREGQVLGLSGGTGRVTGPHLHFAVRWQGEYLDPATLLELTPP